jgi:hypothetical protein
MKLVLIPFFLIFCSSLQATIDENSFNTNIESVYSNYAEKINEKAKTENAVVIIENDCASEDVSVSNTEEENRIARIYMTTVQDVHKKAVEILIKSWEKRSNTNNQLLKARFNEVTRIVDNAHNYSLNTNDYSCMINLANFTSSQKNTIGYNPTDNHANAVYHFYFPVWGSCNFQQSFHVSCIQHFDCRHVPDPRGANCYVSIDM